MLFSITKLSNRSIEYILLRSVLLFIFLFFIKISEFNFFFFAPYNLGPHAISLWPKPRASLENHQRLLLGVTPILNRKMLMVHWTCVFVMMKMNLFEQKHLQRSCFILP
jgi:hypothetical protein